jgi:hypothetical protein
MSRDDEARRSQPMKPMVIPPEGEETELGDVDFLEGKLHVRRQFRYLQMDEGGVERTRRSRCI